VTARTMTTASTNLGVAFQMLTDRPDLATHVTSVAVNGRDDNTGNTISFFTTGNQETVEAWVEFLGPAAQVLDCDSRRSGLFTVTTRDVSVYVTRVGA
jgi:hypothetical protein